MRASRPFVIALVFAAGFVALRLVYRVIFGGWPESLDQWWSVAVAVVRTSMPFVAVVLIFGALNSVIDMRALLARWSGRGPLRNLRTAVVIALSAYPAMLRAINDVRVARRMRGERSWGSLVVPVLERALEQGVALGASLEQRGFGSSTPVYGMCDAPVSARDLTIGFGHAENPAWLLRVGDLVVEPGSCILLTGPTGSGKSALLRALTGRLQHSMSGWQKGVLEVGGLDRRGAQPHETAGFVSLVEQNVRDAFVASNVFDEMAFSARMLRVPEAEIAQRISETAARLVMSNLLEREIHELSAGEASLVAIAAALVAQPSLLLLDEPIADLDEAAAIRVIEVLRDLRHSTGISMIIAEHRWAALESLGVVRLELSAESAVPMAGERAPGESGSKLLTALIGESGANDGSASITPLVARNGAGKTTWLTAFALNHARDVRLVPEDPAVLFGRSTVAAECAHNDRLTSCEPGTTASVVRALLGDVPTDAHPRDLSTGQRLALACALQVSARPALLLLDEPTRGLDEHARTHLAHVLRAVAATGTAVIFATHDGEFAQQFAPTGIESTSRQVIS